MEIAEGGTDGDGADGVCEGAGAAGDGVLVREGGGIRSEVRLSIDGQAVVPVLVPPRQPFDEDGDAVRPSLVTLHVHHAQVSSLPEVGCQVWRGALHLLDLVLRGGHVKGGTALELGCGVGLVGVGLVAAGHLDHCILTDSSAAALDLARANVQANDLTSACTVKKLDWETFPGEVLGWSEPDLAHLQRVGTLLAADVVYDVEGTRAFFKALECLLLPSCVAFVSLEKRINFSAKRLRVEAHCYDDFLAQVCQARSHFSGERAGTCSACSGTGVKFAARRLHRPHGPSCIEYKAVEELEVWELTRVLK